MNTIKDDVKNEIVIQKSKFICFLIKVNSLEEIDLNISKIKKEYPNATHYCFAYVLDSKYKASDDGEPSNTAGIPILNVLKFKNLNHILAIVVRYFGGIKLGTGGLVRAYTKSITNALEKTMIKPIEEKLKISLIFNHSKIKKINYILSKYEVIPKKEFDNYVKYTINIPLNKKNCFINEINEHIINYNIIEKIFD